MIIKEVIHALEKFAPLPLQDDWDHSGLQIGLTEAEVTGALLCLDVTEDTVREAVDKGCNLVVAHHPLLFKGLRSITGADYVERAVMTALKHDVTIYAMHTNMDNAPRGVNYELCRRLGLVPGDFIAPLDRPLPEGVERAGAGMIGVLPEPMGCGDFILRVKKVLGAESVRLAGYDSGRMISRVAVCGGAGSFLSGRARGRADMLLTGEIGYHDMFYADGLIMAAAGHFETEQHTIEIFKSVIESSCPSVRTVKTEITTNPIKYI